LMVVCAGGCCADIADIQSALQSALAEKDETQLQKIDIIAFESEINAATQEEVRALLPLAQKCLGSPIHTVRRHGLSVFFLVSFRPDSSQLIEPYLDGELAPLLDDPDLAFRRGVIVVLGTSRPVPLPRALDALSSQLVDKDNTAQEAGMIAGTLLHGRPFDEKNVHLVLAFVTRHTEFKLRIGTIRTLGLNKVSTEEAVSFIREGINDSNEDVRKTSVEAAGRLPPKVRAKFSADLLRVLSDPNEAAGVRALAQSALQQ